MAKTHFGTVERANEGNNYDEWSNTICGLKEERFVPLKMSDNIKFVGCKKCIKAHPKFVESINRALANPRKEKFQPQGKYEYDVFYTLDGEMMTGYTKGDNQKQAKENFYVEYEERAKIQHFQRYPLF